MVKYCAGILINWEGVVNPDLFQLKIGRICYTEEMKRYGGKWKSLWYVGCEGRFFFFFCEEELVTVLKGLKKHGSRCW